MKTISYIIATKNKLPYLRQGLEKLIAQKKDDEEILIADGASTDGTKEYLEELKRAGKIDDFISEPDYGLAHALNKLVLLANGELLKYLSDDDAFSYSTIRNCKEFMLKHTEVDLLNTEGGSLNDASRTERETDPLQVTRALDYTENYKHWQKDHKPFYFCDLGIMFRRSSIPIVGMWSPLFPGPDIEFSLRTSAGRVNIAWYTGYSYVNISNPQSVSVVYMKKIKNEIDRLNKFYLDKDPDLFIVEKLKTLRNKLRSWFLFGNKNKLSPEKFQAQWPNLAAIAEEWLEIKNKERKPEFLWNTRK